MNINTKNLQVILVIAYLLSPSSLALAQGDNGAITTDINKNPR